METDESSNNKFWPILLVIFGVTLIIACMMFFMIDWDRIFDNNKGQQTTIEDNNNEQVSTSEENNNTQLIIKDDGVISYQEKEKLIFFLEDNLAFSRNQYTKPSEIYYSDVAHYKYEYEKNMLTAEQKTFISTNYHIDQDRLWDYTDAKVIADYFKAVTGETLSYDKVRSDDCMKYIKEYDIIIHNGAHGGIGSEVNEYGITSDSADFNLFDITDIKKIDNNKYQISAGYYSFTEDTSDMDNLPSQNDIKAFLRGEKTAAQLQLQKISNEQFTIKIVNNKLLFVSHSYNRV